MSPYLVSHAALSDDKRHRLSLVRRWDVSADRPVLGFCMLNPSTADTELDDPTIRRCVGFAKQFGFGGIWVSNVSTLRSAHPRYLLGAVDLVHEQANHFLDQMAITCPRVIVAWGAFVERDESLTNRADYVLEFLRRRKDTVYCLGRTSHGQPKHPLYLPRTAQMEPF